MVHGLHGLQAVASQLSPTAWGREDGRGDDATEAGGGNSTGDGEPLPGAEKKEAKTRQRPAGATSTGVGEPLPGAEKKEATTRQRPAGATSTGDGEPLPGAEKKEATTQRRQRRDEGRRGQTPQGSG